MSKFKEGWCRTAHEAMLCKTPVIGSGTGGMKELLEGGNQLICDFPELKDKVEYLLKCQRLDKKIDSSVKWKRTEYGYEFAKQFTTEKFKQSWITLIKKIW